MNGEWIMTIGLIIAGLSVVGAVTALIVFRVRGYRLKKELESEYGPKRH